MKRSRGGSLISVRVDKTIARKGKREGGGDDFTQRVRVGDSVSSDKPRAAEIIVVRSCEKETKAQNSRVKASLIYYLPQPEVERMKTCEVREERTYEEYKFRHDSDK